MTRFINNQVPFRWRAGWVLALLLAYVSLTAFEPYLHAHELDPTQVEDDCAPCNWSRAYVGVDQELPDLGFSEVYLESRTPLHEVFFGISCRSISSRAPPAYR